MDLKNEAISNYVVFFLGTLFGLAGSFITRWLERQRPRKVNLLKANESSLIEVDSQIRDKTSVIYKGEPANSLYLTTFVLWNAGREIIEDVQASINFRSTKVIEVIVNDPLPDRKRSVKVSAADSQLQLQFSYLNPEKIYNDRVQIRVLAVEPISVESVSGGGLGWTVEFVDRVKLISDIFDELGAISVGTVTAMPWQVIGTFIKILPKVWQMAKAGGKSDAA